MTAPVEVRAPLDGTVVALADVPDPVFSGQVVGPGVAVEPAAGGEQTVVAPADGRVATLFPHAFALETPDGRTVLVHLGIDTVRLGGEGFSVRVAVGDAVRAGDPLLTWRPDDVAAAGFATVCPVVALEAVPGAVVTVPPTGTRVQAGDPLLSWS
ncbi:PTS sugar transporter subunit IIA [Cellulosimicrobium marinum]|uniref:PTS sugar transporter subunit IIA n=1 Tax=Cellulosimicrobium marinum TaxID=1638992 RepID=UPI001E2EB79F|nr:PTS glucose transporter subunit IIA [Cellulosimicrobium marinum]MCB7136362.1 PTS glucose transporter subunit IIA [Cellulosimicrobium marinum]